jgi:hypothetical protein
VQCHLANAELRAALARKAKRKENEGDGRDLSADADMCRSDDCANDGPFCLHYTMYEHRLAAGQAVVGKADLRAPRRLSACSMSKGWGGGFPVTIVRGGVESARYIGLFTQKRLHHPSNSCLASAVRLGCGSGPGHVDQCRFEMCARCEMAETRV